MLVIYFMLQYRLTLFIYYNYYFINKNFFTTINRFYQHFHNYSFLLILQPFIILFKTVKRITLYYY